MRLFNNLEFDAVAIVEGRTYTLTIKSGHEDIPANSSGVVLVLADNSGKSARVLMDAAGSTYTIKRVFSTTETNDSFPAFGAGLRAFSSDVAEVLMLPLLTAGVIDTGQSNVVGWNEGKSNLPREIFNEFDNRITYSSHNHPTLSAVQDRIYAIEGLHHFGGALSGAANLGPFIPLAYKILELGYKAVCGLLNGRNSAFISTYNQGSADYIATRDSIINFVNASPLHVIAMWRHQQGESDQDAGTTPSEWVTANVAFKNNIRDDVLAATGVDLTTTPYMAVGLHADYRNSASYNVSNNMEQGIADIPANLFYSAYVPLGVGLSRASDSANENGSGDTTHISAAGYLEEAEEVMRRLPEAYANYPGVAPDTTDPTLSNATSTSTGSDTAIGSVVTDEGNGTLFYLVSQNASETAGTIASSGASKVVSTVGTQNVTLTGLTASTSYYIHYLHRDAASNDSNVITSPQFATDAQADVTAPILSNATGTNSGSTAGSGTVTTDEAGGTLFYYVSANASETDGVIVANGQSQVVNASGVQNVSVTGLTESTTYYLHYLHRDASSNDSTGVSSASWTTDAAADVTAPVLASPTNTSTGQSTADGSVSTDEGNGTLFYYVTQNATETLGDIKANGQSQAVSGTGVQNISHTGLSAGTTYYTHYVHTDAAGNDSNVASATSFTTQLAAPATPLTDALAVLHHYRSDTGLTADTGNEFGNWTNLGSGNDITGAGYGSPTIDANGVNFNGSQGLSFPVGNLLTHTQGGSLVIKYKATASGLLFDAANAFINLTNNNVIWNGGGSDNLITSSQALGDDVEHVFGVTIDAGGTMNLWRDGQNVGSASADALTLSGTAAFLGNSYFSNFAGMTGYIKAIVAKPGVKWTLTDINNIASEMP